MLQAGGRKRSKNFFGTPPGYNISNQTNREAQVLKFQHHMPLCYSPSVKDEIIIQLFCGVKSKFKVFVTKFNFHGRPGQKSLFFKVAGAAVSGCGLLFLHIFPFSSVYKKVLQRLSCCVVFINLHIAGWFLGRPGEGCAGFWGRAARILYP